MSVKKLPIVGATEDGALHRNSDLPITDTTAAEATHSQREAAVLIPLIRQDDQWHILYIRRASNDRDRHSGQVAFPGGAFEEHDASATDTALRETAEEIGLARERVTVLGEMQHYITISRYRVTPVVGVAQWPSELQLQSSEVSRAFLMPMPWLKDPANFTMRARNEMDKHSARRHPIIVYNEYDGETLWGATARMTMNFFKAVDDGAILLPD